MCIRDRYYLDDNGSRNLRILRMTRVIFGATSSPYILAAILRYHFETFKKEIPVTYKLTSDNFYVDDFIFSVDTEEEAVTIAHDVETVANDMCASMTKWKSNSNNVQLKYKIDNENEMKIRGVAWNVTEDILYVKNPKFDHCPST